MNALPPLSAPPAGFPLPPPGLPPLPTSPDSPLAAFTPGDLSRAEVFRRYSIAWFTIAFFDTLATCPEEYEYILKAMWNAKYTPIQFLFLINRWGSLIMQALLIYVKFGDFSPSQCSHAFFLNAFASIFVSFFCSCIVSVRVWALWDKQAKITVLLVLMLITQLCLQTGPASQLHPVIPPPELKAALHLPGCGAAAKGRLSGGTDTIFWVASLAFDSAVLCLTLYRSLSMSKRAGFKIPILRRLVFDGLFYFAVITSSNIVSVIFTTQTFNLFLRPFQAPASLALLSVMCSRLVLSLFNKKVTQGSSGSRQKSSGNPARQVHNSGPTSQLNSTHRMNALGRTSVLKNEEEEEDVEKGGAVALQDLSNSNNKLELQTSSTGDLHLIRHVASRASLKNGLPTQGIKVQRSTVVTLSE